MSCSMIQHGDVAWQRLEKAVNAWIMPGPTPEVGLVHQQQLGPGRERDADFESAARTEEQAGDRQSSMSARPIPPPLLHLRLHPGLAMRILRERAGQSDGGGGRERKILLHREAVEEIVFLELRDNPRRPRLSPAHSRYGPAAHPYFAEVETARRREGLNSVVFAGPVRAESHAALSLPSSRSDRWPCHQRAKDLQSSIASSIGPSPR